MLSRLKAAPEGRLFWAGLKGISDRAAARRATIEERVRRAAEPYQ